jgi:hypothetical protein
MKKSIAIVGLLVFGTHQVYSMESVKERKKTLKEEKDWEKEFRRNLGGYRAAYTLQQFLKATGQQENECEMNVRIEYEEFLDVYKKYHQFSNRTAQKDFDKLEKFKTQEVQKFFNTCKIPVQTAVSGYSQPTDETQKDFCRVLAGCRGLDTLQMLLEATGQSENKAEKRLHKEFKDALSTYRKDNPDNVFIITNSEKLETLNQEARAFFSQCKK